jgi:hypothetical protein
MGNNGKGIGPQKLGYAKSMAKKSYGSMAKKSYGSMAKQTGPKKEPKTGEDTAFNDANNDGNMFSRTIKAFSDGTKRSDEKAAKAKSYQQSINNKFIGDIKSKGFVKAVKDNFRF